MLRVFVTLFYITVRLFLDHPSYYRVWMSLRFVCVRARVRARVRLFFCAIRKTNCNDTNVPYTQYSKNKKNINSIIIIKESINIYYINNLKCFIFEV